MVGGASGDADLEEAFICFRGLFFEPTLSFQDILRGSHPKGIWRGQYLMFAQTGTLFDTDAFALFNSSLQTPPGTDCFDLLLCDFDRVAEAGTFSQPTFTPGWDPDFIQCFPYIETAFLASRGLIMRRQGHASTCVELHDWLCLVAKREIRLRTHHVTESLVHIPPAKSSALPARPTAEPTLAENTHVAVVVPNRNSPKLLAQCLNFLELANQFRTELVIVDNASEDAEVLSLYEQLRRQHGATIVPMNQRFNFARMINVGVAASTAPVILLLNNDVEITTSGLLEQMVAHAMRPEVGVVGSKLLYGNGSVQHGGILLREGSGGQQTPIAEHVLRGAARTDGGYLSTLSCVRNYQAVTGALLATRREVFNEVGGFDEVHLPVEYNDVDYCLRVRKTDRRVLCLPLDGIFHYESSTRGTETSPEVARMRHDATVIMAGRWREQFRQDPFGNPWVKLGETPQARFPWSDDTGSQSS